MACKWVVMPWLRRARTLSDLTENSEFVQRVCLHAGLADLVESDLSALGELCIKKRSDDGKDREFIFSIFIDGLKTILDSEEKIKVSDSGGRTLEMDGPICRKFWLASELVKFRASEYKIQPVHDWSALQAALTIVATYHVDGMFRGI